MTDDIAFLITGIIYLAIILILVRPSSPGPAIVNNIFTALTDLVKGTTGYNNDTSTPTS